MIRQFVLFTLSVAATLGTAQADHFYYGPAPVFAAPVVAYQPAYVVPTSYAVMQFPVTTVSYATGYYAPMVPVSAYYAPVAYAAPVYPAPIYSTPVYVSPYAQRVRSRLHVNRHGGYNYHLHVRGW